MGKHSNISKNNNPGKKCANKDGRSFNSFANLEDYDNIVDIEEHIFPPEKEIATVSKHICAEGREYVGNDEWTAVSKKTKNKKNIVHNTRIDTDIHTDMNTEECIDDGSEYKFNMNWYIWTHLSESTNWSIDSYKHIYTIDSMKSFWEFIGNLDKLDIVKHQFYIMRENSGPTWEHPSNRGGGICSLRLTKDKMIELIEQIAVLIINESFLDNNNEINGFSISAKHMWGVIKIWNKNSNNDICSLFPQYMIKKYSLSPRYGSNKPEY